VDERRRKRLALDVLINYTQIYLLVLARVFALLRTAPMTSSSNIPSMVRIGLTLFCSIVVLPGVIEAGYPIPDTGLGYAALVIGEAMVGIVLGFFLNLVFAAFLAAGQFFSLQMGFGASQVYDPLAQVEIPVMGQFMNLIAMLVFVTTGGFRKIFLYGVDGSFRVLRAVDLVAGHDFVVRTLLSGLGRMFEQALIISFPIFGTLILVYVTMGLLAKAAPQMNLLMLGFPIAIGVAFVLLVLTVPLLMEVFAKIIDASFEGMLELASRVGGGA
jgi:flagellar biosynthesis protein FliR